MDFYAAYIDSSGSAIFGPARAERDKVVAKLSNLMPTERMFSFGSEVHDDVNDLDGCGTFVDGVSKHAYETFGNVPILVVVDEEWGVTGEPRPNMKVTTFRKVLDG